MIIYENGDVADLALTAAFYWYGSIGSKIPVVSLVFDDFIRDAGGMIETDFEVERADDHAA